MIRGRNLVLVAMLIAVVVLRWVHLNAQEHQLDRTKIVFASTRDDNSEIYIMKYDGSEQVRLTNHPANDGYARWSYDGKKIAFVSDRDGNPEIYIMDADGGNQTRITNDPAEDSSPTFSPDGSMIAFNTSRFEGSGTEILRRNIDAGETWGLNLTRLTFSQLHHSAKANDFISWSPDGCQIAFESDRDRDDPEIYLINAVDGTNAQRLTFTRALDEVPSWSPDSKQILWSSDRHAEPHNGNYEIYIMNRDGTNKRRLTTLPGQDTYPSMSPDGSMIVFESWQNGHPEIYRMNADGSNIMRLTTYEGKQVGVHGESVGNGNPSWSPFLN